MSVKRCKIWILFSDLYKNLHKYRFERFSTVLNDEEDNAIVWVCLLVKCQQDCSEIVDGFFYEILGRRDGACLSTTKNRLKFGLICELLDPDTDLRSYQITNACWRHYGL